MILSTQSQSCQHKQPAHQYQQDTASFLLIICVTETASTQNHIKEPAEIKIQQQMKVYSTSLNNMQYMNMDFINGYMWNIWIYCATYMYMTLYVLNVLFISACWNYRVKFYVLLNTLY